MLCPNCNEPVRDHDIFCEKCGYRLQPPAAQTEYIAPPDSRNAQTFNRQRHPASNRRPGGKSNGALIAVISVCAILVVIIIAMAVFILSGSGSKKTQTEHEMVKVISDAASDIITEATPEVKDDEPEAQKEKEPEFDVEKSINSFIDMYANHEDVAVAVMDNLTGEIYTSNNAYDRFSAWGFYLPVYMAYCDTYNVSPTSDIYNVLSSDPATCNNAANRAIDKMGGVGGLTNKLWDLYDFSATSFGRRFGEANTYSDNYTNAYEAVKLLNAMYTRYDYTDLSYSPSTFGLTFPFGGKVYSQIGTENLSVRKDLNVFAVVDGYHSNYCVAVLTTDNISANGFVDDIMGEIYSNMEGISE